MNKVYLLIGGNMGQILNTLATARAAIEREIGHITKVSALYQTAAWGLADQPDFVNQVLLVETGLSANACLRLMLEIEQKLGRIRKIKNGPRAIDIDLLFFNRDIIDEPALQVPHPLLHTRNFTLYPLVEIAPEFVHPVLKESIKVLLQKSPDDLPVTRLNDPMTLRQL